MSGFKYTTAAGFLDIVNKIDREYYDRALLNIFLLEELYDENMISYMTSLRNAYFHLERAITSNDNHAIADEQLVLYHDHLRHLFIDSYQTIIERKLEKLKEKISDPEYNEAKEKMAKKLSELRIPENANAAGYDELIRFIESLEPVQKK